MAYLLLTFASGCSVLASIALKVAGSTDVEPRSGFMVMAPYVVAVVFYCAGFACYALALRNLDLTLAYPLMVALSILGIFLYGILGAGETISAFRLVGALLIGIGIFFISK